MEIKQNFNDFWRHKTVLLTGHTGFKGSWLSLWLSELGAKVIGLALQPPTQPNLFELLDLPNRISHYIADIRDFDAVLTIVKKHQPDIVIHMAAQPLVLFSYRQPIETYAINVMGTVHLLEAIRQVGSTKAIVNVTTDKCYENKEWNWGYRENDRLGGHDPYSNSKACSELVTSSFRNSFFNDMKIGLASARAGNVIGGGDWADNRLVPDIIRACINKQTVAIRNPEALRPWQHVLEPLHGYLLLAQKLYENPSEFSEGWNFGPFDEDTKSVKWIADYIVNRWSNHSEWATHQITQPHEAHYLKLDFSKAKARLQWKPKWNLAKGLDETIQWYQAYHTQLNIGDITLKQIKRHMENV